jgi:hypothetical protein
MVALWFAAGTFENETGVLFVFSSVQRMKANEVRMPIRDVLDLAALRGCYWAPPSDPRMLAQHAVLLVNVLDNDEKCSIPLEKVTIAIDPQLKGEVRELLPRFGINERTLFPDLPGFAGSHGPGRTMSDPDIQAYRRAHLETLREREPEVAKTMGALREEAKRLVESDESGNDYVVVPINQSRIGREAADRLEREGFGDRVVDELQVMKNAVEAPPEE